MSKKASNSVLEYTTKAMDVLENDITKAYKTALDQIRGIVVSYDEKDYLTTSEIVKYRRMETLETQINEILEKTNIEVEKQILKTREDVFIETYNDLFETDEFINQNIGFVKLTTQTVKASIENPLYNANFANSMKGLTDQGLKNISAEITQGIIQGKSVTNIAKAIKDATTMSMYRAVTIARTETLRAMSQAHEKNYELLKEKGFKVRKVWLYSYPVKYSRQDHMDMDGKEADVDGYFEFPDGVRMLEPRMSGDPSHDINCRCSAYNEIIED